MDTDTLVEKYVEEGQKILEQLSQGGFEMTAALWLKRSDNDKWYFYIVLPGADTEITQVYGQFHSLIHAMPQPFWIDPIKIRLVGSDNPIAKDVLAAYQRLPRPVLTPIHWPGRTLGNLFIEDAYFYPLPASTATA